MAELRDHFDSHLRLARAAAASPAPCHADAALLVFDKPTGLLTVPGLGPDKADCLLTRVRRRWPEVLLIHRLDRDTSGLVLFARTPEAQRAMGRRFETRRIAKRYIALVEGSPDADEGGVDLPLRKDMDRRCRHLVDRERGKPAVTRWRVLERVGPRTRLELLPETGRSHQLRVHCAAMGWPIVGDPLYGHEPDEAAIPRRQRLMLHATELAFEHPGTGEGIRLTSDPPF